MQYFSKNFEKLRVFLKEILKIQIFSFNFFFLMGNEIDGPYFHATLLFDVRKGNSYLELDGVLC